MKTHKDLNAWKESIELVVSVYEIAGRFPKHEMFCLTQQLRRAAVSVPSNISEGAARNYKREFIRFLRISMGSLTEVETQVIISWKLRYIEEPEMKAVIGRIYLIRSQIAGLIKSVGITK